MDTVAVSENETAEGEKLGIEPPGDPDNLVAEIQSTDDGRSWLKKMASKMVNLVNGDKESMQGWMDRREAQVKLFAGLIPRMGYPADGARAPHDPIVCRTILQMWTRGCEQITPAKGPLIQVTPVGQEDQELAARREQHMNWQLRHRVPNFIRGHRESYLQFLMSGSVFREHSRDQAAKCTKFEHLTADDIIIPYHHKDIDPYMRRVPRVTRRLRYYPWELEEKRDTGEFVGVDDLLKKAPPIPESSQLDEQSEDIDGIARQTTLSSSEDADTALREFYRCHMWMRLPNEQKMRAVTFIVDVSTMTPVSLKIREDEDPFDRARFDAETKEWALATSNIKQQYQAALQQWQQMSAQMPGLPEPKAPQMPPEPKPIKMVPIFNILHYRLFPNPHGSMGIGIAYLLENANELINQLEAEYLLAAKFANLQTGLLPRGAMKKQRGELRVSMGKFTATELEANEMPGIKVLTFPGPSESMWKFIQKHKEDAYSLVADIDTLTGEAGPTNETKAAAQQRMSNATQLMTAVSALYLETMAEEPKMLARDNGLFMDEREFYWITTADKTKPQGQSDVPSEGATNRVKKEAHREDYASEFDFTFTADARLQTQPERVQTASNMITTLLQSQYVNSPAGPGLMYLAFAKLFRALDMPEFEKAMGPPPPPPAPPPPPQPMAQADENQGFFQDKDHPVLPDDPHQDHLVEIDDLEKSPYYDQMPATGKQMLTRHKAAHAGALYKQETTMRQGDHNGTGFNGTGFNPTGGPPGMGGGPGNPVPPGAPPITAGGGTGAPAQAQ